MVGALCGVPLEGAPRLNCKLLYLSNSSILVLAVSMASQLPPGVDLSTIPLSSPTPGHSPNFENPPDSQASIVLGTGISFGIVSLVFVVLRMWTNSSVTKKLSIDDCMRRLDIFAVQTMY